MEYIPDYEDCNSDKPSISIDETEIWNSAKGESSNVSKYRRIPLNKTLDGLKVTPVKWENLSAVREVKPRSVSFVKHKSTNLSKTSVLDTKVGTKSLKPRPKLDAKISVNAIQRENFPAHVFIERIGQGSISEPTLIAKDRGDSISVQDIFREEKLTPSKYFGDGRSPVTKDTGLKGCVYVKKAGKIYKCLIEAKNVASEEDISYYKSLALKNRKSEMPLRNFKSGYKFNETFTGFRTKDVGKNAEHDDFEVAIFLSGINDISGINSRRKLPINNKTVSVNGIRRVKKAKKKTNTLQKNNTNLFVKGKISEPGRKSFPSAPKMITNRQGDKKSQLSSVNEAHCDEMQNKNKFNGAKLESCSISDNDLLYENPGKLSKKKRWLKKVSITNANIESESVKYSGSEIQGYPRNGRRRIRDDNTSYMSRMMSQSTICDFSDSFRVPRTKLKEDELWERFENIFKSYASTTRHSGEVIPRKISTEWMINAGVVDEILTEKKADEEFRRGVGTKITMNALEYKEFLIMLTLRMKLPYYEIYRRMCGM